MNTAKVKAEFAKIPKERLALKIKRTVVGTLFLAASAWGAYKGWPWYAVAGLLATGAHIISAELVRGAAKFLVATIKDVVGAKKP